MERIMLSRWAHTKWVPPMDLVVVPSYVAHFLENYHGLCTRFCACMIRCRMHVPHYPPRARALVSVLASLCMRHLFSYFLHQCTAYVVSGLP